MNNKKFSNILVAGIFLLPIFRNQGNINLATPTATPIIRPSIEPNLIQRIKLAREEYKNRRGILSNVAVTKVGTDSITVRDNEGKEIKVMVTSNTQYRRRFWGKSLLAEISEGDKVDVIGRWSNEERTEMKAVLIRNLSVRKRFGVYFGTVNSTTTTGFVMTTINKKVETVTISDTTKIINRKEEVITTEDIKVGDRVRVRGLWDSDKSTITEVTQIKNFSIPLATPSASLTPTP